MAAGHAALGEVPTLDTVIAERFYVGALMHLQTPVRSRAAWAVGVEPTLTTGQGSPASRKARAAATVASRSISANAACAASPWTV